MIPNASSVPPQAVRSRAANDIAVISKGFHDTDCILKPRPDGTRLGWPDYLIVDSSLSALTNVGPKRIERSYEQSGDGLR